MYNGVVSFITRPLPPLICTLEYFVCVSNHTHYARHTHYIPTSLSVFPPALLSLTHQYALLSPIPPSPHTRIHTHALISCIKWL